MIDTAMGCRPKMNETTKNFWEAWEQWNPEPPPPVFFRLYHDDHGFPLFYTMEDFPGNYIEVDAKTYQEGSHRVRVRNGQLVKIAHSTVKKLTPGDAGIPCDPRDICVVVNKHHTHIKWSLKTNEFDK